MPKSSLLTPVCIFIEIKMSIKTIDSDYGVNWDSQSIKKIRTIHS